MKKYNVLLFFLGALGVLGGSYFSASALAVDLLKETAPKRWTDRLVPEDLPPLDYPQYFDELDKARAQMHAGRFRLSLVTLAKANDADEIEAALLRAGALWNLGRIDKALDALAKAADDPRWQVLHARILASTGKPDEAITLLKKHLEENPDSLQGRFELGQAYEQIGDLDAAKSAYAWFVDESRLLDKWQGQTGETIFDDAGAVTTLGRALDRWATLTGAYKDNRGLHDVLLNMFVQTYDVIDRGYVPAHVAAAEYCLSHDDREGATQELRQAIARNPNDIAALRLLGRMAVETFNFDGADSIIESLRDIDPQSPVADLLEARNLLRQRRPEAAIAPIERVLAKQPKNLEALGLLAGTYALQLEDAKAAETLKRVETIDPDNATAYFEVAEELASRRQYPRSAEHYKIAIDRAPWWTAPRNGLGLLYTQSGDEDDARATLDAAHALDPFNMEAVNYLRLLDDLAKFARKETAHFIVFYDAQSDPLIPEYFSEYLESIYKEVTANFKTEPPVKTYIEVFPTHDAFSVRTTGSPWIGTVGASTGRVIAMVSPRRGRMTMGTFNWAQVLRHEFTHTVTLAATDNRIAHWMTEGLAVLEEQTPLQWPWVPMLYDAVSKKKLFSMKDLTWGFVRPRRPSDRQLAYAQSFWICQYIDEKYGRDAILKMLDAFKNGLTEEQVFEQVLKRSSDDFTTEFFAWTEKQIASWGYDEATSKKVATLTKEAESLMSSGQFEKARDAWLDIHNLRPMDKLPHMRLASCYLKLKQTDNAAKHLEALQAVELKDNRYAKSIARIYRDDAKPDKAIDYAIQAVYIEPYDEGAHELLAELYEKTNNQTGLSRERRVLAMLSEWRQMQTKQDHPPAEN